MEEEKGKFELKFEELRKEKEEEAKENNKIMDLRLEYESKLDKKD